MTDLDPLAWLRLIAGIRDFDGSTFHVAAVLSTHADRLTLLASPGVDQLVRQSRRGKATVNAALDELLEGRWAEVVAPGGGRGRATVYRLRVGGQS